MTTRLFKANGIEGSLHRARHTYATTLLRTGANIRVVQELMRHKSLSSTAIYTGVDEEELRNGIAGLQARVTAARVDYFRTEASAARTHYGQCHVDN